MLLAQCSLKMLASSMDESYASHVYTTEEKWDPEPWSDLESNSGSSSEECSGKDGFAPKILRRICLGKTKSYVKQTSLESSVSTAASCNDGAESAEEEEEEEEEAKEETKCAIQAGQVHQSSFTVSKKHSRPPRRKREMFRKFVDTLKQRMWAEGSDFDLANVELPCSYKRDKIQKILESSVKTPASCNECAESAEEEEEEEEDEEEEEEEEDCAIQEGQVHQNSFKVPKKSSRPPKRQRDKFRKFVDILKQRMWAEGSNFDLANMELPCSYKRDKIQKILDTFRQGLHVVYDV